MSYPGEEAVYVLLVIGLAFASLGVLGLIRFPDFYTRLHAATKCTTFGAIFIVAAVAFYSVLWWRDEPQWGLAIHAVFGLFALLLTNPAGAHALARAAYRAGLKPKGLVVDELAEDLPRLEAEENQEASA